MTITWTRVYYYLAKEIIDRYGDEGEELVKIAAKKAGDEDGKRMRKLAIDWGMEPNPKTFLKAMTHIWPEPNVEGHLLSEGKDKRSFEITYCPIEEEYESLPDGKRIGVMWQKSYHPGMWNQFDPEFNLEVEASMIGGDKTTIYSQTFKKNNKSQ